MHGNGHDLTGQSFGRWTVISRAPNGAGGRTKWHSVCACGAERAVAAIHLVKGSSSSCGKCARPRGENSPVYRHGKRGGVYSVWLNIIQRCENPNNTQYHDYGGRGITMCRRWREDYGSFVDDMGPRPTPKHQIDRKNNNLGYSHGNCEWATRSQNMLNTRRNHLVSYQGETIPLAEAARRAGVNYGTAKWRLRNGRSDEEALR